MTEKTDEEKQEEFRQTNVKKTLENEPFQDVLGSNLVRTNPFMYGQLGVRGAETTYDKVSSGEEFNKVRNDLYKKQSEGMRNSGVYGEPSMSSNGDVSLKIINQLRGVMRMAKLSELEEYAKDVGAKLDVEVSAELRDCISGDLIQKATNNGKKEFNPDKLDNDEKNALKMYEYISQAYERACALSSCSSNYFSDINANMKKIADEYKPAEESQESEE